MSNTSTPSKALILLRKVCFGFLLLPFTLLAQTTHTVIVGPALTYNPAELTITAGDQVTWISEGGTHDVNFDKNTVTGNSFGNPASIADASLPTQGAGTMGSITFPEVGTYDYDCSVGAHAQYGMVGKVVVNAASVSTPSAADEILELFTAWNTSISLDKGWNMFGYGCPEPKDVIEVLSAHTDKIIIVKNNSGKAYLTEYGFNGIGDFLSGQGYQVKLTEAVEGFSLCDAYIEEMPARINEILNID
jgi:plastocyanin